MRRNTYERQLLYQEVWEAPMREFAQRYGISDVMLKRICRQLDVPTPPRGYWAKRSAGKKTEKPALPNPTKPRVCYGRGSEAPQMELEQRRNPLCLLGKAEEAAIHQVSLTIKHHPKQHLRPLLAEVKSSGGCPTPVMRVNHPQFYCLDEVVSSGQVGRAMSLVETLARSCEQIGGQLADPLSLEALGETVHLQIRESVAKENHTLSREEERAVAEYERTKDPWRKPNIRKWDQRFTGSLSIRVLSSPYRLLHEEWPWKIQSDFNERRGKTLEEQVSDIFMSVCQTCAAKRLNRLDKEAEMERHEAQVAEAQRKVVEFNSEVSALNKALDESKRYEIAHRLRQYAFALEQKGSDISSEYVAWLRAKSNWLDPTIAAPDNVFGVFDSYEGFPKEKDDIRTAIPYDLRWFFERHGSTANQTWQQFLDVVYA